MKNILLLLTLFTSLVSWGQRVNIDELTVSNDTYFLNGSSYNGSVYVLYDSGQLMEDFVVKNGKIEGKIIYHQDNLFRKDRYKDTTLITQIESNLSTLNDELSSLEKDSSAYYNRKRSLKSEMGDKFYKYKEKYNEGKLKGNKLELYEDYLIYTKKLKDKTRELVEKRIEKNNVEKKLNTEKSKSEYTNKIKDGYEYEDGSVIFHVEYDKNEKPILAEELKDGVRNGSFNIYENEKVKEEGTYLNNKKDGLWTLYPYNGKEEITYSNDVKNGEYKKYNGDVVIQEGQYKNGLMTGEWIFRWDNGNQKGQGKYIDGDGGNVGYTGIPINGRDGEWIFYHENGNKELVLSYVNGKGEGESISYHENGNKKSVASFVNGKIEGEFISYHENGNKEKEGNYNNNLADGPWKNYYENGNLHYDFEMRNGKSEFDGAVQSVYKENGEFDKKIQWNGTEWVDYVSPEEKERRRVEWENHQKELLTMKHKCRRCNSEYIGQGWDYHLGDEALSKFYRVDKNCSVTRSLLSEENDYCSKSCASQSCEREKERRGW